MSFGLSPGDIVLFAQFAKKTISALKEGGSKMEYQIAERQCQEFLSVLKEVQCLDLSKVPDSFRHKLAEYSTNISDFVREFRKTIDRYEKSMGKSSQLGAFRSAPRKVRWAYTAAGDLAKFRQSLSVELGLVNILIQTNILSIVGNYNQPGSLFAGPSQSSALSRSVYQSPHYTQHFLTWDTNPIYNNDALRIANDISLLVYERLLSGPGISSHSHQSINTLPGDYCVNVFTPQLNSLREYKAPQSPAELTEPHSLSQQETLQGIGTEESSPNSLVSEINEYLLSMNMDELSMQEKEYLSRNESIPRQPLLQDRSVEETTGPYYLDGISGQSQPSTAKGRSGGSKRLSRPSGADPLSALSFAVALLQVVSFAAKSSFNLMNFTEVVPKEVRTLSTKLMRYSEILHAAVEVVSISTPDGKLQQLGEAVLHDNLQTMEGVEFLMTRATRSGGRFSGALRWRLLKRDVETMMEELESLKSTLSVMLQLYQVKMTGIDQQRRGL